MMAAIFADDIFRYIFMNEKFCILVPNRQQAIIWFNADQIHWCIYGALRGDELCVQWGLVKIGFNFGFLPICHETITRGLEICIDYILSIGPSETKFIKIRSKRIHFLTQKNGFENAVSKMSPFCSGLNFLTSVMLNLDWDS